MSRSRRRDTASLSCAATVSVVALLIGCAGDGRSTLRASLEDVDPFGGYWAIRSECTGSRVQVEFRPGERISVRDFGHASDTEIAVECGDPKRVPVSNRELRRRTARPSAADLAAPTFERADLACDARGPLLVEAHPVWSQYLVVGGAVRIMQRSRALVDGAIISPEHRLPSQLRWWRAVCRRVQ